MSFKEQIDQILNSYVSGLPQAGAINALIKNLSKNITFQGNCKDWESLPSTSSNLGDCYWVQETNDIAVWTGAHWVRMDSTFDLSCISEWHECPEVFHSPEDPFHPFRQKTEEEKLHDMADALTLLALS